MGRQTATTAAATRRRGTRPRSKRYYKTPPEKLLSVWRFSRRSVLLDATILAAAGWDLAASHRAECLLRKVKSTISYASRFALLMHALDGFVFPTRGFGV